MSQYSEMIGSFVRTGNYPIEANYIFETYADLVSFFSDEVQKATLHKGLLKIVEQDENNKQALYWVTEEDDELVFTKLLCGDSVQDLLDRLSQEVEDRQLEDLAIWGTDDKSQIPDDLNSIYDLANEMLEVKDFIIQASQTLDELTDELDTVAKAITGSPTSDIVAYLETLDYKNLTEASEALNKFLNTRDSSDTKINTLPELQDFLQGITENQTLSNLLSDLKNELWGDPIPNAQFRTLRGVEDYVETLTSNTTNRDNNLQTELDQTQVGVGLSGDGSYNADNETHYLKNATSVMNALKILDGLINEAINNCNLEVQDSSTVNLSIDKYSARTVLTANVLVSSDAGNGIIAKSDGLYHKISSEYSNGTLTLKVNDNIIAQHVLGLAFVGIRRAYYDTASESIVMEFKKEDGTSEELRIPATQLIREWVTDNTGVTDTVVLTRVEDYSGNPDKVSADVRLYSDKYNILTKEGNSLYVKGTADNIVWNDVKVSVILDQLAADLDTLSDSVSDIRDDLVEIESNLQDQITAEVNRAQQAELGLTNTFTASQQVQDNRIAALQTQANNNTTSCQTLLEKINDEITDRTAETARLSGLIATERNRAEAQEALLSQRITDIGSDTSSLSTSLQDEITRATAAEQQLQTQATTLATGLSNEVTRAQAQEAILNQAITNENVRAEAQEAILDHKIDDMIAQAIQALEEQPLWYEVNDN